MNRLAALLTFSVILAAPCFANDDGADQQGRGDICRQQVQAACPDLKPGDGKFRACLKEHKDDISENCRAKIRAKFQAAKQGAQACRDDAAKFCPDTKPGDGKFGPCMKEHKDDLSPACRRAMAAMGRRAKKKAEQSEGNEGDDGNKGAPAKAPAADNNTGEEKSNDNNSND